MKLRSKDLATLSEVAITAFIETLANHEDLSEETRSFLTSIGYQTVGQAATRLSELTASATGTAISKALTVIEPFAKTLPKEFAPENLEDELTFTMEGDSPESANQKVVIHNSGDNPTFNVFSTPKKKDKMQTIEDNIMILARHGVHFDRKTTYHVQVEYNLETWNFYLTSEKYHRNGVPKEGQGINNFLAMMKIKRQDTM